MSAADHGNQHQKYNHLSRGPDLSRMYLRSLQSQADTAARTAAREAVFHAIVAEDLPNLLLIFAYLSRFSSAQSPAHSGIGQCTSIGAGRAIKNEGRPARDCFSKSPPKPATINDSTVPLLRCLPSCLRARATTPTYLILVSPEPRCILVIVFVRFHLRSDSSVSIQ